MSLFPKDPGLSNFAIPTLTELIDLLADNSFGSELIFSGGDLSPATLLNAYQSGLFPMPIDDLNIGWFSPITRGTFITMKRYDHSLPIRVSKSLKKSLRKFSFTLNYSFEKVIEGCADPSRPGSWINKEFKEAYLKLHELGWAHSLEVWTTEGKSKALAGGLYGVAIGGLFAGESMFHNSTDASKAGLVALISELVKGNCLLLDTQWITPHLASLGALAIPRQDYMQLLEEALTRPLPPIFTIGGSSDIQLEL